MSLTGASVFLDFDGTITTVDTRAHLMGRLAPTSWQEIEASCRAGEIDSRECLARQWALLPPDRRLIERVAREVDLDAGFTSLVGYLVAAGAEVTILSEGYGFRAEEVARATNVAVVTNTVDWDRHEVVFTNEGQGCPCGACATCKRLPITAARARGRSTVLVGDGLDDAKAAEVADVVFAKGELASWCAARGIAFRRFRTLDDVLVGFLALGLRAREFEPRPGGHG